MSKGAMEISVNESLGFSRDVKFAKSPCGNCHHPECSDCFPRPKIKTFDAPKDHPEFDPSRIEWAKLHLVNLTKHKFWGNLTLKFEDGKIVHAVKTENLKP